MAWTRTFLTEFIEEFRANPSVWNVKSKSYHNRQMKENAYAILVQKVQTIEPEANKEMVLKKINNLRSSFRKEHKKVVRAKKDGTSPYVPKLWYYQDLLFLVDQEGAMDRDSDTEISDETKLENATHTVSPGPSSIEYAVSNLQRELHLNTEPEAKPAFYRTSEEPLFKCRKTESSNDKILATVDDRFARVSNDDKFETFGKHVAAKLRSLGNREQRIYAEKLINDALFEAELGSLSRYSSINTSAVLTYDYAGSESHVSSGSSQDPTIFIKEEI